MSEQRRKIKVTLFDEFGSNSWPLSEFITMLRSMEAEVADGYEAAIELESDGEVAKLDVHYWRLENDEERAERLAADAAFKKRMEDADRVTYLRLKEKFEGK